MRKLIATCIYVCNYATCTRYPHAYVHMSISASQNGYGPYLSVHQQGIEQIVDQRLDEWYDGIIASADDVEDLWGPHWFSNQHDILYNVITVSGCRVCHSYFVTQACWAI